MTLWMQGLLLLTAMMCVYQGLSVRLRLIVLKILRQSVFIMVLAGALTTLWCLVFYGLLHIPLNTVRPWGVWPYVLHTMDLNLLPNLALWSFPAVLTVFIVMTQLAPLLEPSWRHLYGNAHWASRAEISRMGFLNGKGNLLVGNYQNQLLQYAMTNHVLVFAPSRSGKGVSVVIPNALAWRGSLLVTDNKYEVFEYTSGYRNQQGNAVYRFSPADKTFCTHRINPLDYVDRTNPSKRITDLHLILDILIVQGGEDNRMWAEEARSIALGLLLWLMQSGRPFTLGELSSITKGGANFEVFLQEVIDTHILADNLISLDPVAFLAIQSFIQKAPKEQSGVRTTLTSMLRLWEDPLICAATACSDVDFRDMRKQPITLYLSFGTDQISRLSPLINLIVQLFLNLMLSHLPQPDEPCKVLCLLDEINRFGRMDKLKDGFGDLAGYGVHLLPIIQNLGQFYATYGGRDQCDVFFQNTDLKIAFRQNADTDKQWVSHTLGKKTQAIKNRSYQTSREGASYSESLIERPLLSPEEVGRFPMEKQILITGNGVVQCKKILYYKDKRFKTKLLPAITVPSVTPQYPIIEIKKNPEAFTAQHAKIPSPEPQTLALIETLAASYEEEGI